MKADLTPEHKKQLRAIERKAHSNWTIDDWVLKHYALYGGNDKLKSPMALWLQVITEGAQLAENVRRGRIKQALDRNIPQIFGWLIAFAGKYIHQPAFGPEDPIGDYLRKLSTSPKSLPGPESFGKWILQKYPGVCSACGHKRCICSSHRKVFEERKEKRYDRELRRLLEVGEKLRKNAFNKYRNNNSERDRFYKLSVDKIIDGFIFIYGGGHEGVELWQIAAHLLEEIGEAAYEIDLLVELQALERLQENVKGKKGSKINFQNVVIKAFEGLGSPSALEKDMKKMKMGDEKEIVERLRSNSIQTLKEELADVFSWICAFLFKVGEIMREVKSEEKLYKFDDWLEEKYFDRSRRRFICFACHKNPCEDDCRAVWFTQRAFRDIAKERHLPPL